MTIVDLLQLMVGHSHPTSSVKPIHSFLFWSFVDTYSDKSGDLLPGTCLTGQLFGVERPRGSNLPGVSLVAQKRTPLM